MPRSRKNVKVDFSRTFEKQLHKAPRKVQQAVTRRVWLLLSNSTDPLLRNHALTGEYSGFRSINITGDWRAIFVEENADERRIIRFHLLGTHSRLYR